MGKNKIDPKNNYIFFGLDELEFTVNDIDCDVYIVDDLTGLPPVWELDNDNTTRAEIDFFDLTWSYTKINPQGYKSGLKFSTIISFVDDCGFIKNKTIDCFALIRGRENAYIKSSDKIVFYSSFFVLEYLKKLPFSLYDFMACFSDRIKLHRLDIALDLPYKIDVIKNELFKNVNFHSAIGYDDKKPEFSQTYYIKNPQSNVNRKYIFRIYDKIRDTWLKKKAFLYPHLLNNPDVRRIELELRAEECKKIMDFDIYDILENKNKVCESIFAKFFNKHSNIFLDYKKINFLSYSNQKYDLKMAYMQYGHIPSKYLSRSHGYIKTIKKNTGYDGLFQVLLGVRKNNDGSLTDSKVFEGLEMLEELIKYLIKENLGQSLINKILKKYIFKPKIKIGDLKKKDLLV